MKYLLLPFMLSVYLSAIVITGNQDKVSVTSGSISVTGNDGVTQVINSGEISFIDEAGASKSRKVQRGDLNDIYDDLKAANDDDEINLKYDPLQYIVAKKIKAYLVQKGISRSKVQLKRFNASTQIYITSIPIKNIKKIYPEYYTVAKNFFKKSSNKGKIPTLTMKKKHIHKYHKKIIRKFDK